MPRSRVPVLSFPSDMMGNDDNHDDYIREATVARWLILMYDRSRYISICVRVLLTFVSDVKHITTIAQSIAQHRGLCDNSVDSPKHTQINTVSTNRAAMKHAQ